MSLAIMFRQADAAHLITDGGMWDDEGVLVATGSKVATFSELNMAIGFTGYGVTPGKLWRAVESSGFTTTGQVLRGLPIMLRELVLAYPCPRGPDLTLYVITYDPRPGPACWMISTGGASVPPPYVPFTLAHMRALIDVGDPCAVLGRPVDITDSASFDPIADGRALADFARVQAWEHPDGHRRYHVGGFAELTTVGPAGLHRQTLREWPEDRVGELTVPSLLAS